MELVFMWCRVVVTGGGGEWWVLLRQIVYSLITIAYTKGKFNNIVHSCCCLFQY